MTNPQPVRYAVASCWHESFETATPGVPTGPFDLEEMRRRISPADRISIWPLTDRCRSLYLQWAALWVLLELTDGRSTPSADGLPAVQFDSARVLHHGRPEAVCAWLLANSLPTPADGPSGVTVGRNTERIVSELGGVLVAGRWGRAEAGFHGIACAFMGDAIAGQMGVAVNTCSGGARAADKAVAITTGWSDASAGAGGVAAAIDEFTSATARDHGSAIAGFGGRATVGRHGVAMAQSGTVQGGEGSILIIRGDSRLHVARVGENGIKPDTPYHLRGRVFVEGAWDAEAWSRGELN